MLLEVDADPQLWQDTVRDAVAKQCPASLVRGVAENKVDAAPLWGSYVEQGWTESVAERAGARTQELGGQGHWWMLTDPAMAAADANLRALESRLGAPLVADIGWCGGASRPPRIAGLPELFGLR